MARHLRSPFIEGTGYVISMLSVAVLARVAWIGARSDTILQGLIALGVILSLLGMVLRWYVWNRRHRKRHKR